MRTQRATVPDMPCGVPWSGATIDRHATREMSKVPFFQGAPYEGDETVAATPEDAIDAAAFAITPAVEPVTNTVVCSVCGRECKNAMSLLAHSRAHKPKEPAK